MIECECRRELDGSEFTCKFCEERRDHECAIPDGNDFKAAQPEPRTFSGDAQ